MGKIPNLMSDIFNPPGEPALLALRRGPGRAALTGFQPIHQPGPRLTAMGASPGMADAGIQHYTAIHPEAPAQTAQMTGLLSAITSYLSMASMQVRSYAKSAFPVLMRTDFSRLYKMLSEEEKDFYCTNNAQNFIDLVQSIPFLPPINMANPVFEGGIYHSNPGANHTILNGLSKDVWIRGIARGTDLLTKRNFPVRDVRDELESIGGYGNKTDMTGGAIQMPILELRSMPSTPLANWANVTDEVFRYVYNINHGYNIKYGEYPVPAPPGSI